MFGTNTSIPNLNLLSMLSRQLSQVQADILRLRLHYERTASKLTSTTNTKQGKVRFPRIRLVILRMSGGGLSTLSRNLLIGFLTLVLFGSVGVALTVANAIQSILNWLEPEH